MQSAFTPRLETKATHSLVSEAQATSLFGERRFLSAARVVSAWNELIKEQRTGRAIPALEVPGGLPISYQEQTLVRLAEDPTWFLLYEPGLSLRENRRALGTDPERQPCHLQGNDWWLADREDDWATRSAEPGYYLVRLEGLFPCDNPARDWDWQEEQVHQMGDLFSRAPTHLLANACVSCFLLNGERHIDSYHNFGPEMDADHCFLVMRFDAAGLNLGHWLRNDWGGYWGADLQVCVVREFDS